MKSLEAKALQAYILRDGLCHPDYLENKKYKRIFTLLKWKYRKIWKQIENKIGMPLHRGLHSQNDYVMKLFNELNWWAMTSHAVVGTSFFKCKPYYTMRVLNYK
jgi:hypothetical protein